MDDLKMNQQSNSVEKEAVAECVCNGPDIDSVNWLVHSGRPLEDGDLLYPASTIEALEAENAALRELVDVLEPKSDDEAIERAMAPATIKTLQRQLTEAHQKLSDMQEVLDDKKRLVRDIDVIMNGEKGAAKQASLCDLIPQIKQLSTLPAQLQAARLGALEECAKLVEELPCECCWPDSSIPIAEEFAANIRKLSTDPVARKEG